MSWLPLYNAWVLLVGVVSLFFWNLVGVLLFLFFGVWALLWLARESLCTVKHYATGFWLFIASEVVAFFTLFYICSITEEPEIDPISSCLELPLLGCFVLTGSSITLTTYHHYLGSKYSRFFLLMTIMLGLGFITLQIFEFYDCDCDLTFSIYQAVCFCTVGLHFLHVVGGVTVMSILYSLEDGAVPQSNIDFVVWYWHFVDYIWLFVYLIIYLS